MGLHMGQGWAGVEAGDVLMDLEVEEGISEAEDERAVLRLCSLQV